PLRQSFPSPTHSFRMSISMPPDSRECDLRHRTVFTACFLARHSSDLLHHSCKQVACMLRSDLAKRPNMKEQICTERSIQSCQVRWRKNVRCRSLPII